MKASTAPSTAKEPTVPRGLTLPGLLSWLPRLAALACLACLLSLFLFAPSISRAESVVYTKHNLSVSGTGSIKATTEREICIFCHAPHNAGADTPLWNHTNSSATYIPYSSATLQAKVGQPDGASKLCLSCHDGTVAIGNIHSRSTPIAMQNGVTVMPSGPTNLGTDLSQDHPISFVYDNTLVSADPSLASPSTLTGKVRLDHDGKMQCTACHDPHDNQYGNFLVMDPTGSALCSTCHLTSPTSSNPHSLSKAPLTQAVATLTSGTGLSPALKQATTLPKIAASQTKRVAKTVADNGCKNCHASHGAAGAKRLLLTNREEQTCFMCHNGTVDRKNLEAEFTKLSVHPVLQTSKLHDAGENLLNAPRHVACSDCHNSHMTKAAPAKMPALKNATVAVPAAAGPIVGVKGMNRSGTITKSISYEYELCFRCHGDDAARQASINQVTRVNPEPNKRRQFDPSNSSYHPVVARGRNSNVPSLIAPYTASSTIQCTDCHNNDQGPGAGGTGPNGPHGSAFAPLLERRLVTADQTLESEANYALCYKCHSRESILNDQSFRAFNSSGQDRGHRFHVVDQKTACTTCHDSHGVATNSRLINFNPTYVTPASNGRIEYRSAGVLSGNCTLTCHGFNHVNSAYPNSLSLSPAKVAPRRH